MGIMSKILGAGQDKLVKQYARKVEQINALEPEIQAMSDEDICAELQQIRRDIADGVTDDSEQLIRVYALGREHIRRTTGKRAYDVQLIGGMALNDGHIAEMQTGQGKANPVDTPIPTPDGWKTIGDIKKGDKVFGPDGKPTTVIDTYPQGQKEIYEVVLKDGRIIPCADEHRWSVYTTYRTQTPAKTWKTKDLYEHGARHSKRGYQFHLPTCDAVEYEKKKLTLDPYVMGLMLGDGYRNDNKNFLLSCADEDIENVKAIALSIGAVHYAKSHSNNHTWKFYSVFNGRGRGHSNICINIRDIAPEYEELLSEKYCYEKWIPEEYKIASIEQRWALVQGLMDSDGNIGHRDNGRYNMQFSTTSPQLRDDLMEVLYSLGISCSWRVSRKAGKRAAKHDQYTIAINVPHDLKPRFFRLSRKKEIAEQAAQSVPKKKHYDRIAITDIRKTGEFTEQVCLEVDHPSHLFLIGNYVVTHNTITTNFPILLNALAGRQVHVFTVNEYLSGRDADICRDALRGTGVSVGYIYNQQPKAEKIRAYACDVVYGTPSEFGFDYLRDNMVTKIEDKVQPFHDYAIIDEIDSILIDEARTPLIISGAGNQNTDIYKAFALAVQHLRYGEDFDMDEAKKTISPTERGLRKIEKQLGIEDLYSAEYNNLPRYLKQAMMAQFLYHRDKDYIVDGGEVKIVDPNTGRIMEGRRWSEGLHQAIEAKERVEIQQENETLATVTLQNFFRMYDKLSGCTGTAMTEDAEFRKTYGMGVVSVPTHKPVARIDAPDVVYKSLDAKYTAIADEIAQRNAKGQPVLVGTVSVENSEKLSVLLNKRGIKHLVLNAKNHEKEAHIVAQAGRLGAVTIATNMAGRGTDIMLGGNPDELFEAYKAAVISKREPDPETGAVDDFIPQAELDDAWRQVKDICEREQKLVLEAGGLCVIGSERHESRRIDNQLRGRAGRQGDPGYSQFYISLEDDLMRLFGQDKMDAIKNMMSKAGMDDSMPLDAPMVSKAIESAQHQVESMHYDARKQTLEYDDVLNKQRLAIYSERDLLIEGEDMSDKLVQVQNDVASELVDEYCFSDEPSEDWDFAGLREAYGQLTGHEPDELSWLAPDGAGMDSKEGIVSTIGWHISQELQSKSDMVGKEQMSDIERQFMLNAVDFSWRDHLNYMDYLKSGVGLRSYGQRDPLTEYKDEAYKAFTFMVDTMYAQALTSILRVKIEPSMQRAPEPAHPNMFDEPRAKTAVPGSKRPTGADVLDKAGIAPAIPVSAMESSAPQVIAPKSPEEMARTKKRAKKIAEEAAEKRKTEGVAVVAPQLIVPPTLADLSSEPEEAARPAATAISDVSDVPANFAGVGNQTFDVNCGLGEADLVKEGK